MPHGIDTCKYCKRIFAILVLKNVFEMEEGIRFNQLLRFAKMFADPKMAAPTLYRHLKQLTRSKIVKKTRKGKQHVVYSLPLDSPLFTKEDWELSKEWYKQHEKIKSWTLKRIISNIIELSKLLELETLKLWFQKQLPGQNLQDVALSDGFVNAFYKQFGEILHEAAKGKTPLEYKEAINMLEREIADMKKELFAVAEVKKQNE